MTKIATCITEVPAAVAPYDKAIKVGDKLEYLGTFKYAGETYLRIAGPVDTIPACDFALEETRLVQAVVAFGKNGDNLFWIESVTECQSGGYDVNVKNWVGDRVGALEFMVHVKDFADFTEVPSLVYDQSFRAQRARERKAVRAGRAINGVYF